MLNVDIKERFYDYCFTSFRRKVPVTRSFSFPVVTVVDSSKAKSDDGRRELVLMCI